MVREMRKCSGSGKDEIMDKAVAAAAAKGRGERRKRKFVSGGSEMPTSKTRRLVAVNSPEFSSSPASFRNSSWCGSFNSGYDLVSCCSISRSSEVVENRSKVADREPEFRCTQRENEATVEFFAASTRNSMNFSDRRENMPPVSGLRSESGELKSTARQCVRKSTSTRRQTDRFPNAAELEEFFSVTEKNLQKQFTTKYNFDIVKEEAIEGRYEWIQIQLKP